uniref:condensation domain-containing protein n=1 Tax=Chitinolyticbacter albus TaxID=2961951 RepID=UPI00210A7F8E
RQLGQHQQATLFMTLAAAFQLLLHRQSRQRDLCIGYPVAGRNQPELEGLIGFFVNTLVLRTRIDPAQPFEALLQQVRATLLAADAHQDLPFDKLVEVLRPDRSLNQSPLFQVMFAFYDADQGSALRLAGVTAEVLPQASTTAKFDLSLELTMRAGRLSGRFEYSTELFDAATIASLARQFHTL